MDTKCSDKDHTKNDKPTPEEAKKWVEAGNKKRKSVLGRKTRKEEQILPVFKYTKNKTLQRSWNSGWTR